MERMEILTQLQKQTQHTLKCNPGPHCWCAQISYRFPLTQAMEECVTPKEMLEMGGNELSPNDNRYLKRLVGYALRFD